MANKYLSNERMNGQVDKAGRARRPRPAGEGLGRGLLLPQPWAPWLAPAHVHTHKPAPTFRPAGEALRLAGPWACVAHDSHGCPVAWMEEEKAGILAGRTELGSF